MKLRPPSTVMRLARMGAMHATRLSFMPTFLRHAKQQGWEFNQAEWEINSAGVGHACYRVDMGTRVYALVAFAHDLPDDMRSDRVIAEAWDATFALHDGIPTKQDIDRLRANVPLQEAGRVSTKELVLSRANRSGRMWGHVVDALAAGQQPDKTMVREIGYLMRTTAVYGSGKFGAADRIDIRDRPEFKSSFQVEMLTVFLIREFVLDLVEHMARMKGGDVAVPLTHEMRRMFGIGNSTGLGMAPFLVNHPALLHRWMHARETALARVLSLQHPDETKKRAVQCALITACANAETWTVQDVVQAKAVQGLRSGLAKILNNYAALSREAYPWSALLAFAENQTCLETQEQLVACLLEPYGDMIDDLADDLQFEEEALPRIDGTMSTSNLKGLIEEKFDWMLKIDFDKKSTQDRFWYYSENKYEPRLGQRFEEPGAELEFPLAIARDINMLHAALPKDGSLAEFLLKHPKFRQAAFRVQALHDLDYAEIHDNLLCETLRPVDMLRCKLSFFGATKFDPRSDRWLRIVMYQYAPLAQDLMAHEAKFADAI
ncbi:MAG: hypothetical protein AAF429_04715 [Pseudomonadota bacterium]